MAVQKLLWSSLWNIADTGGTYRYAVYGDVQTGEKYIKTAGASTTVSENASGDGVFQGFANGDLIHVKAGADGAWSTRIITDATNAPSSVVVDSNITLTGGKAWSYQKWNNGTAATDGWFSVAEFDLKSVQFEWVTDTAASAEVRIEGRINGGNAALLYAKSFSAVGAEIYAIPELVNEIRVGAQITTDAGTNNVKATFIGENFGRF